MLIKPTQSLVKYARLFDKCLARKKKRTVLDYGSGNLRNSLFMHRRGYEVFAVDLPCRLKINALPNLRLIWPEELPNLPKKIDVVICTFVLNLISPAERMIFLDRLSGKMSAGGYFLIETRGLTLKEIDKLALPRGFVRIHHESGRYTVIALYQYNPEAL